MTKYEIFAECFPRFATGEDIFGRLTKINDVHSIEHYEDGTLAGYALIDRNALRLLCVLPQFRGQGIGTKLLTQAEEYVKAAGYNDILTGGASSGLFIGAPEESWGFFREHGYVSEGQCDEMTQYLSDFNISDYDFRSYDNVHYDWYRGDEQKLLDAVADVAGDWVQYFRGNKNVYCGFCGDDVACFCIIDNNMECMLSDGENTVGAVGCVGTVHKFRKRGIGIKMVALATDILKNRGAEQSFIHYTGVADWYAKIGYKTLMTAYFGRKEL